MQIQCGKTRVNIGGAFTKIVFCFSWDVELIVTNTKLSFQIMNFINVSFINLFARCTFSSKNNIFFIIVFVCFLRTQ